MQLPMACDVPTRSHGLEFDLFSWIVVVECRRKTAVHEPFWLWTSCGGELLKAEKAGQQRGFGCRLN